MTHVWNVDDPQQRQTLLDRVPVAQVMPRRTVYGHAPGIIPFGEDQPDKLVDPKDYKEVIAHCHEKKIFPVYHQRDTWAPEGRIEWNQDGLNYCWAWGATAGLMDCLARETKPFTLLSPVSMGWTVNWKNAGNYLEDAIKALKDRGVCESSYTPDMHSRNPNTFKPGWEQDALKHRLYQVWDGDCGTTASAIQHLVSILKLGVPCPDALNWWSHALEIVSVEWDESVPNNLVIVRRNSHAEKDVIRMTGNKAIPDEFYGYVSSKT
jgi:hypothetical protein